MSEFHLLRPHWLWLLLLLLPVLWTWWRQRQQRYSHYSWLAAHLAKPLLKLPKQQQRGTGWLQLALAVLISAIALAGPSWERLPQPVYQLNAGQVIILDMSLSTRATDVSPDRLTQLRYKARDLLSSRLDGETGLVAYAGDAFVISPLTSDKNNLLNLIPALSPEIMPEQGNYPQVAFARADEMLRNAGYPTGDIFWLTDGVESRDFSELTNQLRQLGHRVSTLAVGTREGAPIRQTDGTLLRDASGQVVVPRLYPDRLRQLTELTGGVFTRLTVDSQDIEQLLLLPPLSRAEQDADGEPLQQGDQWLDRGPWLALLLLPLALLHWRRNGMLGAALLPLGGLSLLLSATMFSGQAQAQEPSSSWWLTAEQQAQQALEQKQYERAAELSNDPLRRGTANYRAGNYEDALTDFAQVSDATGYYNQGNSLMQLEDYQGAVNAYQEALRQQPDMPQAQANLQLAKQQLEQQQQDQEQQQSQNGEQNQSSENSQGQQGEQGSDDEQQSEQQSEQQQQDSGNESNQEQQPQDSQEQQQDDSGQTEQQQAAEAEPGESEDQAQQQAIEQSMDGDLDAEQQREFEQMLKRLPDDPALLLRQKMRLEYQKRQQQQRRPEGVQQQW
ncbi:MAG: VWA domain-containing protein [Idiomarina sp.]